MAPFLKALKLLNPDTLWALLIQITGDYVSTLEVAGRTILQVCFVKCSQAGRVVVLLGGTCAVAHRRAVYCRLDPGYYYCIGLYL